MNLWDSMEVLFGDWLVGPHSSNMSAAGNFGGGFHVCSTLAGLPACYFATATLDGLTVAGDKHYTVRLRIIMS